MNPFPQSAPARNFNADDAVLLCLNAQGAQFGALAAASADAIPRAIDKMQRCLDLARAKRVPVLHVFNAARPVSARSKAGSAPSGPGNAMVRAIASLRPNPDEPVLIRQSVAFRDSVELQSAPLLQQGRMIFIVGFSLATDCLLAVLDFTASAHRIVIVEDAVVAFDLPPYSASESKGVILALLSQFAAIVCSDDLKPLEKSNGSRRAREL